jgi:hypothetical protein
LQERLQPGGYATLPCVDLTFYTLPDFLIAEFPELREDIESEYLEYLSVCANPYPHVFLGSYLTPMLVGSTEVSEALRRRAGEVLEIVLNAPDADLAEAALLEVCEGLSGEPELLAKAWPWLGPAAREWIGRLRAQRGSRDGVDEG